MNFSQPKKGGAPLILSTMILWAIAMLLLLYHGKERRVRWLALTSFLGGCTFLSNAMLEMLYSNTLYPVADWGTDWIRLVAAALFYVSFTLTPYAYACFSIRMEERLERYTTVTYLVLLIMPIFTLIEFWPQAEQFPYSFQITLSTLVWTSVYIVGSSAMLVFGTFFGKQTAWSRLDRRIITILTVPVMMSIWLTGYVLNHLTIWRYNGVIIFVVFFLFVFLIAKYGILGLRLRFERERLEGFMRSYASGTKIMNHAFKNQIAKIQIAAGIIRREEEEAQYEIPLDIIEASAAHMSAMLKRIQGKLGSEAVLSERLELRAWLQGTTDSILPELQQRGIQFELSSIPNVDVRIDPIHVREVVFNLIRNAAEALDNHSDPRIEVRVFTKRHNWAIEVRDNGTGIPRQDIHRVMEPFFTTKMGNQHEGLGLAYCYSIIQKHEGRMSIKSDTTGTKVQLVIPGWWKE